MVDRKARSTTATSSATVNYDLPLWSGEDITTWQGNLNDAMNKIDTAIFEAKSAADNVQIIGDDLKELLEQTKTENEEIQQKLGDLQQNVTALSHSLSATDTNVSNAQQAIINLNTEYDGMKAQMDTMADDIGKMMEMMHGKHSNHAFPIVVNDDWSITDAYFHPYGMNVDVGGINVPSDGIDVEISDTSWFTELLEEWSTLYGYKPFMGTGTAFNTQGTDVLTVYRLSSTHISIIPVKGSVYNRVQYSAIFNVMKEVS